MYMKIIFRQFHSMRNAVFEYIDTVDLGFGNYGLDWFKLYEKLV